MKRLLARLGLPVLAAVALQLTSLTAAHADPGGGLETRCTGWIHYDINIPVVVDTCTYHEWYSFGEHWNYRSVVRVRNMWNNSVTARVYLQLDREHMAGNEYTVEPWAEKEYWGPAHYDVPWNVKKTGRAWILGSSGWWFHPAAPSFP